MPVKFEIEAVFKITGRGYIVTAVLIGKENGFWLPEGSMLGTIEVTSQLSQPRAIDEDGNPRIDLWAFQLNHQTDFDKLKEGEIVELFPGDGIKFFPPWMKVESDGSFEKELEKEISNEHILFGKQVKAIGKREDNDDVLFAIGEGKMAVVHLTWNKESSLNYPRTSVFNHWTEVYEKVIVVDNREYEM